MSQYNKPYGIMFHHFYNGNHKKGQGAISSEEFEYMIVHHKILQT